MNIPKLTNPIFDTSEFSDEFCKAGEFTGTFVGMFCVDSLMHQQSALFDSFEYHVDPKKEQFDEGLQTETKVRMN